MPTYELRCGSCGDDFDRFLTRLIREEDKVCPSCGSRDVKLGVGGGFASVGSRSSRDAGGCVPRGGFG